MSGRTDRERDSRRIRTLMETYKLDKDPGIPRIAIGLNGVLLFRVGPLYFATKTSAAKLWEWSEEMPTAPIWHEMTDYVHQLVFHADDLKEVCECVLDHGEPVVLC